MRILCVEDYWKKEIWNYDTKKAKSNNRGVTNPTVNFNEKSENWKLMYSTNRTLKH